VQKDNQFLQCCFLLLGLLRVKAAHKKLVKSTPAFDIPIVVAFPPFQKKGGFDKNTRTPVTRHF